MTHNHDTLVYTREGFAAIFSFPSMVLLSRGYARPCNIRTYLLSAPATKAPPKYPPTCSPLILISIRYSGNVMRTCVGSLSDPENAPSTGSSLQLFDTLDTR